MNERITPSNITELKENEIFVFGSNSNGVHNGNAAATAMKFGAIMGQAAGIQGQTYAMPSKHIENLKKHIDDFLLYAEQHSEYTFLVTEIGCGISKHSPFEIAPLFKEAVHIKNINLPLSFWDVLNGGIQARIKQVAEKEVSIRPTTGIKPLYTTIATVTMNLIVSAAIVLLNPYVTIYISYKIPPFALSVHIPDVSTSIYVEVDSKVLLGLPFCDKAFVR